MYAPPFPVKFNVCLQGAEKISGPLFEKQGKTAAPFLLDTIIDEHLIQWGPEYVADIFSKLKKVNLSLPGKQLTVFVASDKFKVAGKKIKFQTSYICHLRT